MVKWLMIAGIVVSLSACEPHSEEAIRDSRSDFMEALQEELDDRNVPYTVDDKGYIRYSSENSSEVEQIVEQIDDKRKLEVGTRFEEQELTAYFRKLLDKRGIQYRTETSDDGEWTYWNPESKQQEERLERMVVEYALENNDAGN